ncbi:MAG: hypothetical protein JSU06_13070 [Actinobacteria bacterium]|nr:hypothetical protein [Actinomycetota bacterium]
MDLPRNVWSHLPFLAAPVPVSRSPRAHRRHRILLAEHLEAPFNDVRVRRAVNYAVDRNIFSQLSGGQLSPTQQILPPDLPGYRKSTPYPHDMAKA